MTNKDRYKKLFEELVENYFSNEKFIQQREALENENLDDEYKAYVLEKFKSRTPEGWFKYIANKERTSSIVNIKNENLPPEIEVMNLKRVNDTKFEETQPGIETKLNIEVFENLYFISNRRSNKKEKEKQIKEFPSFKYRVAEIKKYLTDLETTEDKSEYLLFLKKELEKVIYAFENTVLRKYSKENNNLNFNKASELAKFIEDLREVREIESCEELNSIINGMLEDLGAYFERTDYYKKYYYKLASFKIEVTTEAVDDYVGCGVMDINEKIVKELKILRICENYIDAEISYLKGRKDNSLSDAETNTFGFDFIDIVEYAEKLEEGDAIEYLNKIYEIAIRKMDFEDKLDKLSFEDGIRQTTYELQYRLDIKKKIVQGNFKTYDFMENLIFKYANKITDISLRLKYFEYVIREIKKVRHNLYGFINQDSFGTQYYSEYVESFHRRALLFASYECGEDADLDELKKIIDQFFLEKLKNLEDLEKQIVDEIDFLRTVQLNQPIEEASSNKVTSIEDLLPQFKGLVNNKKELDFTKDQVEIKESEIDQDTLIEKFQRECERRKLQKGKTIPLEILFEIAKAIGMKVEKLEDFKSGENNYQIARQYASLLKYKRKKPDER